MDVNALFSWFSFLLIWKTIRCFQKTWNARSSWWKPWSTIFYQSAVPCYRAQEPNHGNPLLVRSTLLEGWTPLKVDHYLSEFKSLSTDYLLYSIWFSLWETFSSAACKSTTNNKLRVCLHLGSTTIEKYDLRTNKWIQVGIMNGRRLQFGVAVIDNKLYVVGGRDGLKTSNMVECYNPITKVWSTMPPMSTHRHGLGAFFECFRYLCNLITQHVHILTVT